MLATAGCMEGGEEWGGRERERETRRGGRRWEGSAEEDERQQKETSIPVWWVFVLFLVSVGPSEAEWRKKRNADPRRGADCLGPNVPTLLMKRLI